MKKLILIANLTALAFPSSLLAAFSCSQAAISQNSLTSMFHGNLTIPAGGFVLAWSDTSTACGNLTLSVTDDGSNTYTQIDQSATGAFDCVTSWYAYNTAAATKVTWHNSGTVTNTSFGVAVCSGVSTTSPLDGHAKAASTSGSSAITTASFGHSGDMFIAIWGDYYAPTWTAGNGGGVSMTIVISNNPGNGLGNTALATSTGTAAGSVSLTEANGNGNYGAVLGAAFLPGAAGPAFVANQSVIAVGP